jgi:hypothetical protein
MGRVLGWLALLPLLLVGSILVAVLSVMWVLHLVPAVLRGRPVRPYRDFVRVVPF